jgi:hypothetical protein
MNGPNCVLLGLRKAGDTAHWRVLQPTLNPESGGWNALSFRAKRDADDADASDAVASAQPPMISFASHDGSNSNHQNPCPGRVAHILCGRGAPLDLGHCGGALEDSGLEVAAASVRAISAIRGGGF